VLHTHTTWVDQQNGAQVKVTLPADAESAIAEVEALATLLDKTGWKAAAFIAVSCKPGTAGRRKSFTSERFSFQQFTRELDAKGWSVNVISRHYNAWEAAAEDGFVPHAADLIYGGRVELPTEGWQKYYPPTNPVDEDIAAQAARDGVGAQTAAVIAQNTKAMATAIKASPKVAKAAAQALIDNDDLSTLSAATAAVAQNRQVERNRKRLASGVGKGSTVQGPKPSLVSPDVAAFMSHKGLADALRALVTTFPQEWESMSDEAKTEDYIGVCEESFDKIEIALANCRNLVAGGVSDSDIERLLEGNVA
jgi:hypothetical protein